ncbi:MAG: T9SS type A sorting domain-containing protein [Bacteroidota bacterium]
MKTILFRLLLLSSLCLWTSLHAQDAALYNQAKVNAFNDSIVPGTVHINGHDITDISPLLKLKHAGNLRIRGTSLTDLSGLDSLKTLTGKLEIDDNDDLTNIDALHNLETLNKLQIGRNEELKNLNGLGGLHGGIDTIFLERTDLTQIDSLMGLRGDVKVLDIRFNELINLDGLIGITGAEEMYIYESKLLSIDGLYNLRNSRIVDLRLVDIFSLSALAQLDVTESIYVNITGLHRLDAFYPVRQLASLSITNCHYLSDFSGLDSLRSVDHLFLNDVMIYTTDVLDVSGLNQLSGSISEVIISGVKDLRDMSIFDDVASIHDLRLDGNDGLQSLNGLDSLKNLDKLSIEACGISSLQGFPAAEDSLALLFLQRLPNLESLEGLEGVQKLDVQYSLKAKLNLERLGILNVDALSGLSGRYGGLLKIINNEDLQNLDGLAGISEIGYGVHIQGNSALDSCCVLKNLLPGLDFWNIEENKPSCSRNEILKPEGVCYGGSLGGPDPDPAPGIIPDNYAITQLRPNPTEGEIVLQYASPEEEVIQVRIMDVSGRLVMNPQSLPSLKGIGETSLDLSRLNPGLYFIQMLAPELGKVHKLILY